MTRMKHICGFYFVYLRRNPPSPPQYLPLVSLSSHTTILASVSRTVLDQTFVNTTGSAIPELRYTFPLYDGASVVAFTCTIDKTRVIRGVVRERNQARQAYQEAVDRGETAGLLERLPDAADVFTTTIGNVAAGAEVRVTLTYLLELKHDAEVDGIRFTLPTSIAPRYGAYPGELVAHPSNVSSRDGKGIQILVDVEMPQGSSIKSIQSPSHPISVSLGRTSTAAAAAEASLRMASATLSLGTAELDKDFVLQVVVPDTAKPVAVLETHPTMPNHRALMATLVPRFNLPSSRPEIVFVCDRSGSMREGNKMPNLKSALRVLLKSLPVGVKFNICSFGSSYSFLFPNGSVSYSQSTLDEAMRNVDTFEGNLFGTEITRPLKETLEKRYKDMDLEVFLLTDGEVWNQEALFSMINEYVSGSDGAIRIFTLGIGRDVSHALIEGVARAGNGFSQAVGDDEKMDVKVVRMLKASLTPHVKDYSLEVKYAAQKQEAGEEDFELVERVLDGLKIDVAEADDDAEPQPPPTSETPKKPISLFDPSADPDAEIPDPVATKDTTGTDRYAHVPAVPPPKLLQAPFRIPPLFPFNRTSVYLLMSPETAQRTPSAVVLRGTSAQGPLELEVPVSILDAPGETVHQLAARKAVQDLEEGRGWLSGAADPRSGALLRDRFPGRFADMVEREAVRLGVAFQVAGRWCSFVAVEDGAGGEAGAARVGPEVTVLGPGGAVERGPRAHLARAPAPVALSAAPAMAMASMASSLPPASRREGAAPPPRLMRKDRKKRVGVAVQQAVPAFGAGSARRPGAGAGAAAAGGGALGHAARTTDPWEAVVALQTFEGFWRWSDQLLAVLGVDGDALKRALAGAVPSPAPDDVVATAAAVAFLRRKHEAEKDAWEMLVDKAMGWLDTELGGPGRGEEGVRAVEVLF